MRACQLKKIIGVPVMAVFSFLNFSGSSTVSYAAISERFVISVTVDTNESIDIEVVWPKGTLPKALVVVVPSTGGLSDAYFDSELNKPIYDPDSRGGLTKALNEAGFAAAFYNQRGFNSLRTCITGKNFQERALSFVKNCVDAKTRGKVSLSTISSDTAAVFTALSLDSRTKNLLQIALAYSEGMHHVSSLTGKNIIKPAGIISVGGPVDSMAELSKFQITHEYYLQLAETAFQNCKSSKLQVIQIFSCAQLKSKGVTLALMVETFGGDVVTQDQISSKRKAYGDFYREYSAKFPSYSEGATMNGTFGGYVIPTAWAASFYTEIFKSTSTIIQQLGMFGGKVIFISGALDYLVPVPISGKCPSQPGNTNQLVNCEVIVIKDLGHALEDETGLPTKNALSQIILAIYKVSKSY